MDWLTALAVFAIVAGVTIGIVVLLAVRSLRGSLNEGAIKQSVQIRRLVETVAALNQQQQNAHVKLQLLADANKRLADELTALGERVGDVEGNPRTTGSSRLLH